VTEIIWTPTTVALSKLKPRERNPKRISKAHAARLLDLWERLGQFQTIAIGPAGEVYDGHQRLSVLKAKHGGGYVVQVLQASRELTEAEREELTIAAHSGTTGSWDWDALAGWDVDNLTAWGLDEELLKDWNAGATALREMLAAETAATGEDPGPQVDKASELQAKWGTATGQLWQLGEHHRLICGDCTDAAVVAAIAIAPGERMDLWLTDPPYAVGYADKNRYLNAIARGNSIQVPIVNDHLSLDDASALWKAAALVALDVCADHASYYWFACQGGDQMMMMMMMLSEAGWRVRHELIWVKNNHVLGRTDYNYKHEPILYGWKKDGKHRFFGGFQTSVLEFAKPQQSDLHPTTKPVALVERLISNSTEAGQIVFDGFLGSGTTLIACERLGRRARCVEIEPGYVAVALERWATMTGKTPTLLDGAP